MDQSLSLVHFLVVSPDFLVTNEESQAAIEEIETLNEEMQATNEELETLNEELQATVEELNTSNADLAARGDELQDMTLALEVQKSQLETILTGLADAVLVVTHDGKTLLSNEAYRRLFRVGDVTPGTEINSSGERAVIMADDYTHPLLPGDTPQARAARGETFNMIFTMGSTESGERRWFEALGQPLLGDNGQTWGVMVVRDITERSLRTLQEQFTSLASHELRTPLTAIKGYLQLLTKSLKVSGTAAQLRYLEVALAQTNKQMRLTEDLLDVTRLQSGKFNLVHEPVRLDTFLRHAVEIGQVLSVDQKIELTIDKGDEGKDGAADGDDALLAEPMFVSGDAVRLEQAVLNLVGNAITHAPESTRIDVRLCRVQNKNGTPLPMAEINVQDYGKGIATKDLPEVFARFYQVGLGKSFPTHGLGLGLFIAKQIVEGHGGTISVESKEGEGATFIIRLPLVVETGMS